MDFIFSFDGSNIRKTNTQTGAWTALVSNWHDVKAMTMHKGTLIIAADTSVYSMNPETGAAAAIVQHWRGICALLPCGDHFLVLAEGGWYKMNPADGSASLIGEHPLYVACAI